MGTSGRRDLWGLGATPPVATAAWKTPHTPGRAQPDPQKPGHEGTGPMAQTLASPSLPCECQKQPDVSIGHQGPELSQCCPEGPASQGAPTAHRGVHSCAGDNTG